MATTPVEIKTAKGLTLTFNLYALKADTLLNAGDVLTENTNAKGIYSADVTEALTGWHDYTVTDASSNLISSGTVFLVDDTSTHRPSEYRADLEDSGQAIPLVTTVTTLTGHTAQTGDSFAIVNGASGSVATKTVVDAIPTTAMRGTDSAYTGTPPTAAAIADQVWDEVITTAAHNVANSAGKRLRQSTGLLQAESAVDDPGAAATTTAFDTDLTEVDNFWNDSLIVFTSGALAGQAKPILTYTQASGAIVLDEALTSAPADNDEFTIYSTHIHSVSQIADGVWDEATSGHVGVGSTGLALTSIFTTAMTESYAADGAAPTPAQSLFLIQQALTDVAIVSTTETIRKLDGSTAAATLTLDSASAPTSKTRAT